MEIENLPEEYEVIWKKCSKVLEKGGRPGDLKHAQEIVRFILGYQGNLRIDQSILIPVAMMHDIGHAAILPEHFKYITGPKKLINGKLVHMLAGAKIANDILAAVDYNQEKSREIVDIISIHDADQLKDASQEDFYDTENKKIFHDIDSLDRFTDERIRNFSSMYKDPKEIKNLLEKSINNLFYEEFRQVARERMNNLRWEQFYDKKPIN